MTLPLAHETWFEDGHRALDWSFAGETLTLALLAVDVPFLARLAPWMPFAVRLHLASSSAWRARSRCCSACC